MPVIFKIAFRNLRQHKSKSLIIGFLLALGVAVLVVGNAFMDTAAEGLRKTFTANYTGDVFVHATTKSPMSVFGVVSGGPGQMETTPVIPDYDKIWTTVKSQPGVASATSQVTSFALVSRDQESEEKSFAILFGVEPESYRATFDAFELVDGHWLEPGEEGLVLPQPMAERIAKQLAKPDGREAEKTQFGKLYQPSRDAITREPIKVGDKLVLQSVGSAGFKIRVLPIVGIVKGKGDSEASNVFAYADIDTVRIMTGLTLGNDSDEPIPAEQQALLATSDEASLFGGETTVAAGGSLGQAAAVNPAASKDGARQVAKADKGAWHSILARVDPPALAPLVIAKLNQEFAARGLDVVAQDWQAAAGPYAVFIDGIRIVFNVIVIILAIVALIVMINTLVISVMERRAEIGTMRALGGQRGFVRRMFFAESIALSGVAGLAGLAVSAIVIAIVDACRIEAGNAFFAVLFGGKFLWLVVSPASVILSVVLVVAIAAIANLYPVALALRIQPVRAMQAE